MGSPQSKFGSHRPSAVIAWGSSTGYTEEVAAGLHQRLRHRVDAVVDIADINIPDLEAFDVLILGVPTWHVGELQDDWDYQFEEISKLDLRGKVVALFGCGDADGYPLSFQDALGIMWQQLETQGATLIGEWPREGYRFLESQALTEDGLRFVGLAIDEHSQCELTEQRLDRWAAQVEAELALWSRQHWVRLAG
ncbi:MAG: flavodoxin [Acidobacteriota bacterium]